MTEATFIARIESGKSNYLIYSSEGKDGLVSVWKHDGSYILTWEECPAGQQYDESTYTRDQTQRFAAREQVIEFLKSHGLNVREFKP